MIFSVCVVVWMNILIIQESKVHYGTKMFIFLKQKEHNRFWDTSGFPAQKCEINQLMKICTQLPIGNRIENSFLYNCSGLNSVKFYK